MFSHLLASAPKRSALSTPAVSVSTALHALVVLAVAWGTTRATEAPSTAAAPVIYANIVDEPTPVNEPAAPAAPGAPAVVERQPVEVVRSDVPAGFQELIVPDALAAIPAPARVEVRAADFGGVGVAGGVSGDRPLVVTGGDAGRSAQPAPLSVAVVDEPPRLLNRGQITARMKEVYPTRYRMEEVEGQVLVQLVVGTDGRVEADGLSVVSASHPEFEGPSRELVRLFRFEPARRNGQPVRVWVRVPLSWQIG